MGLFSSPTKPAQDEPITPTAQKDDRFNEFFDEVASLPAPQNNTVIAKGVTISGVLQGEGSVQIEGNIEGEILVQGSVFVTTTGKVHGPIEADTVRIAGHVVGNITANNHLRLEHTGHIEGDIAPAALLIEDGGRLDGRSAMLSRPIETKKPSSAVEDDPFASLSLDLEDEA